MIHVFMASVPCAWPEGLWSWLDADERQRAQRFVFDRDRHAYIAAHALLRYGLNTVHGRPACWGFARDDNGKPYVCSPDSPLRFNLSHCQGMVAVAVGHEIEVGVDVEADERAALIREVTPGVMADAERAALQGLSEVEMNARLVALWVAKEAVAKACGVGLQLSLSQLVFEGEPGRLTQLPPSFGPPQAWRVCWQRWRHHVLAVAARQPSARPLRVHWSPVDLARLGSPPVPDEITSAF